MSPATQNLRQDWLLGVQRKGCIEHGDASSSAACGLRALTVRSDAEKLRGRERRGRGN